MHGYKVHLSLPSFLPSHLPLSLLPQSLFLQPRYPRLLPTVCQLSIPIELIRRLQWGSSSCRSSGAGSSPLVSLGLDMDVPLLYHH